MHNDWVKCITDNVPYRYGRQSRNSECHYTVEGNLNFDNDIEPLPLTEEILKANGFLSLNSDLQHKYSLWIEEKRAFLEYNFFEDKKEYSRLVIALDDVFVVNVHILYVHELQHALRLCGLNDFADNFKAVLN